MPPNQIQCECIWGVSPLFDATPEGREQMRQWHAYRQIALQRAFAAVVVLGFIIYAVCKS